MKNHVISIELSFYAQSDTKLRRTVQGRVFVVVMAMRLISTKNKKRGINASAAEGIFAYAPLPPPGWNAIY